MADRKYVSLENLKLYDEKIKTKIATDDAKVLTDAKAYADSLNGNYDAAGSAATALADAKKYTDEKADAVQGNLDKVDARVATVEKDYLKAADKTELDGKITVAKDAADNAQKSADKVAADLATEASTREAADNAQVERISGLEEKIKGLTGAMHFRGVETELPKDVSGYAEGDVIIVGEKEYVFNGTEFKEFGDVSAEGARIATLETEMDAVEALANANKAAHEANATAIAGNKAALEAETSARESTDTALDTRLKAVESAVGESGSVADDIASAKAEAIATAAADATKKADQALADAKEHTNTEVAKDRARLDALETDSATHALKTDLDAVSKKVTTAEGEIDQLQTDVDAVEALAAANDAAIKALQTASATHALKSDLDAEVLRATAAEEANAAAIAEFKEIPVAEINAMFE